MNFSGVSAITIPQGDVKQIAIGGVTVWTKPNPLPYDAEVEYLESTGTQYVDTGVNADNTTVLTMDGVFPSTTGMPVIFGLADNTVSPTVRFNAGRESNGRVRAFLDTSTSQLVLSYSWGARTTFELDAATAAFRVGSNVATRTSFTWASNLPIYLFARNGAGTADNFATLRVCSVTIKKGSTLVRSYVPVRVGQTGYLYDRVSGTLFGNAGTGSFTIGPDKA